MKKENLIFLLIPAIFIIITSGCGEGKNNILISDNNVNTPPKILLINDEYETADTLVGPLPYLWVVASDKDGPEDIAAVVLEIEKVEIEDLIVRPTDPNQDCMQPYYVDMDTINIMPYLDKTSFKINKQLLQPNSSGGYSISMSYFRLTDGGLANQSGYFGRHIKNCEGAYASLYMIESFGFYPPAPAQPEDIYVTYIKLLVSGMKITVYDQSGETDTKTIPGFICYFTNSLEEQTLP